ncbi:MAG: cation-transporting P-type ATPase [Clostridia bacterium]|nr:cation-transporting P-type ATPase [Clostridia bacterium]
MNLLEVDPEKLRQVLGSSEEAGLSTGQALQNLREFGPNTYSGRIPEKFGVFKRIFGDILLIVFVLMCLFLIITSPDTETVLTLVFTLVGYLVFTVGSYLYSERVKTRVRRTGQVRCRVKRDGKLVGVDWRDVVPGDTLYVEKGEVVPCDGIIIRKRALKVLEANVTGKCEAVIKQEYRDIDELSLPYFDCILFAGTVILNGTATVLVCNTGRNIFDRSNIKRTEESMPKIHHTARFVNKQLGLLWIPVGFLIFAVGIVVSQPFFEMFFYALALMVAAVPDAAGILSELCVAVQVSALMKRGCVLRNFAAIDKIPKISCISVHGEDFFLGQTPAIGTYLVDDCPYQFRDSPDYAAELLELAVVASNSEKTPFMNGERNVDRALAQEAKRFSVRRKRSEKNFGVFSRREYDDRLGFSSVFCMKNGRYKYVIRGNAEKVLRRCSHIKKGDQAVPLNQSARQRLTDTARSIAVNGEFVLAVAVLDAKSPPERDFPDCIVGLTFVGFLGLYTPVMTTAAEAAGQCVKNNIDVLLLNSGDPDRSFGLAKSLSLVNDSDKPFAMDERMYQRIDKGLLLADLKSYKVFCGLDPGEERDIVRYRNEAGDVTAAVTDSLVSSVAQSEADVSFVFRGSHWVSVRHNADVLLDRRSFEGVYTSMKTVRAICRNVSTMLRYVIFVQFALAFTALSSLISFGSLALTPLDLVVFGLFVCVSGSVALINDYPYGARRSDQEEGKDSFTLGDLVPSAVFGAVTAIVTCLSWRIVYYHTSLTAYASAAAIITLFASAQSVRLGFSSEQSVFRRSREFNVWGLVSIALSIVFAVFLIIAVPSAQQITDAIPDFVTVLIALVWGLVPLGLCELAKLIRRI